MGALVAFEVALIVVAGVLVGAVGVSSYSARADELGASRLGGADGLGASLLARADAPSSSLDPADLTEAQPDGRGGYQRAPKPQRKPKERAKSGPHKQPSASSEFPPPPRESGESATSASSATPSSSAAPSSHEDTISVAPPMPADASSRDWGVSLGLGIPHPFFLEAEHRWGTRWSGGLGLGGIYIHNVRYEDQPFEINMLAADVRARWYPWDGAFFVGAALGIQRFDAGITATIPVTAQGQSFNVFATVSAAITSFYLTPHAGWFKVYGNGFLLGFDIGIQLPVSVHRSLDIQTESGSSQVANADVVNSAPYKSNAKEVDDAVAALGKTPLPYVTLFRVGWMF